MVALVTKEDLKRKFDGLARLLGMSRQQAIKWLSRNRPRTVLEIELEQIRFLLDW